MGTVHHISTDDGPLAGRRSHDPRSDLELPGWEEFTTARDRFFANLRAASERYRTGAGPGRDDAGASER